MSLAGPTTRSCGRWWAGAQPSSAFRVSFAGLPATAPKLTPKLYSSLERPQTEGSAGIGRRLGLEPRRAACSGSIRLMPVLGSAKTCHASEVPTGSVYEGGITLETTVTATFLLPCAFISLARSFNERWGSRPRRACPCPTSRPPSRRACTPSSRMSDPSEWRES